MRAIQSKEEEFEKIECNIQSEQTQLQDLRKETKDMEGKSQTLQVHIAKQQKELTSNFNNQFLSIFI